MRLTVYHVLQKKYHEQSESLLQSNSKKRGLNTHCLTSTLLFDWITVNSCQSCSCSLNVFNLKIICKIWHLAGTVCSSDYYLNTYCFTKCTIIFCFHNSLYVHTAYTASFFIFLHPLIPTLLFLMMPKGEKMWREFLERCGERV